MTRNLHTADTIVKLALSVLVLLFYYTGAISGPFAVLLVSLSVVVIFLFIIKALNKWFSDRA